MIGKLLKTALISAVATMSAVVVLRRMERDQAKSRRPRSLTAAEIEADQIQAPAREAMLAELEAQL